MLMTYSFANILSLWALTLLFLLNAYGVEHSSSLVGIPTVIDGNTLEIDGHRIRLQGVDVSESMLCEKQNKKHSCGQQAAHLLDELIANRSVRCESPSQDKYKTNLAYCFVGNINLNKEIMANKWAVTIANAGNVMTSIN